MYINYKTSYYLLISIYTRSFGKYIPNLSLAISSINSVELILSLTSNNSVLRCFSCAIKFK